MNRTEFVNSNIRLDRDRRPTYRRLALVGVSLLIFAVLWRFVSHETLFWLMLPVLSVLLWVASHGWRFALLAADAVIHRLMEIGNGGLR